MTGTVTLPDGVEMVMPGDNVSVEVELIAPVAMEKTLRFAIREGGRTVGAGRVAEILMTEKRRSASHSVQRIQDSSSIGRVAVSKTVGWGFESLLSCGTQTTIRSIMIRKVRKFIGEVRVELNKAQWPWDANEKGFKTLQGACGFHDGGAHRYADPWRIHLVF